MCIGAVADSLQCYRLSAHFCGVCCSYFTHRMWSCICFVSLEPKYHNHNPVIMTYFTRLTQTPREHHVTVFYTVCLTTLWRCSNASITFSGSLSWRKLIRVFFLTLGCLHESGKKRARMWSSIPGSFLTSTQIWRQKGVERGFLGFLFFFLTVYTDPISVTTTFTMIKT